MADKTVTKRRSSQRYCPLSHGILFSRTISFGLSTGVSRYTLCHLFVSYNTTPVDLANLWSISATHCLHGAVLVCNVILRSATSMMYPTGHLRFMDLVFGVYLDLQFIAQ
jgi:hypothetical protein